MKTTNHRTSTGIDKKEMKELFAETKETLAAGILKNNTPGSSFTILDLWRIQKKHKSLGSSTRW